MKMFKKNKKDISFYYDILITVFGIALIIFLILVFFDPNNKYIILAAFTNGGLINVLNGLKLMKNSTKKSMGMTSVMLGIIIIFIGIWIINLNLI